MSLKQNIFLAYRAHTIKKHQLTYLFWECTLRCNLNCRHCGSDCKKEASIPDMEPSLFLKALDEIKQQVDPHTVMICITGGEPLLRNDLESVGKEITARGFPWGIVTNGMLLTSERFSSLLRAGLRSVSISIDGPEEAHNWLRRNPRSFEHALSAAKLVSSFAAMHPGAFSYDVITCVNKHNFPLLDETKNLFVANGIKFWRIFSIFPNGRATRRETTDIQVNDELSVSSEQYHLLMEFIQKTRAEKQIHVNYSCEGYLGKYELKVRDFFFFCRAGVNVAGIFCDGSVSGCLSIRARDFVQGNITSENFMDIWNTRFANMRDHSWAKVGMCEHCASWKYCLGNGLHLHGDVHSACAHCNLELLEESIS